jgi:sigma-B regulation protein RsbU (phosphoserine phosphatase)
MSTPQQLVGGDAPPDEPRLLPAAPGPVPPSGSVRAVFLRSWPGRTLLGAIALRVLLALADRAGVPALSSVLGLPVAVALVVSGLWVLWRVVAVARRRLLWRVRRKLIISYIFIGVVPALLVVAFFLFAGLLMFFHVSAYLFKRGIDDVMEDARSVAQTAAIELRRGRGEAATQEVLERKLANSASEYPMLSIAVAPRSVGREGARSTEGLAAGSWAHDSPPRTIPEWVSTGGFTGLLAYHYPDDPEHDHLVIRAVGFPEDREPSWGVVVDIPVDEQVIAQLREATGIDLQNVNVVAAEATPPVVQGSREPSTAVVTRSESGGGSTRWSFNSAAILEYVDWATGGRGTLLMGIRVAVRDIYDRIAAAQSRVKNVSLGDLFMLVLGAIAILFLIIEAVAFVMGLALARSITGSIHELFVGTQRVQLGDFSHRIRVKTRDQLGELADSFNDMTGSIEALLRQAEEKKRLEEELRIAREIQMSLLPRGPLSLPGLAVTALCVPAREVGGDYYDFFPLGDRRLGVLIADVAGKGTSAALYMAELKGLVLSLSTIYESPRQLLIEVNRIISANLDSRSFITMTYAVVDLAARTLTYARAGHTPLIYFPGEPRPGVAQVLAPEGLVVGLRIEGAATRFEALLEEATLPLRSGDVFVLYTDGITEAMNPAADLFGEQRLQALVEEHGDLPSDQLRERILREVEAFVGEADPHDDMTMILLKVEQDAGASPA